MNYTEALANFIQLVTERTQRHFAKNFDLLIPPKYEVIHNRKYDKVISISDGGHGQRSVYCWIDPKTGDIMKGSWKAIEDKRSRGNIFNADPLEGTNIYGVDYLNMSNEAYKE